MALAAPRDLNALYHQSRYDKDRQLWSYYDKHRYGEHIRLPFTTPPRYNSPYNLQMLRFKRDSYIDILIASNG